MLFRICLPSTKLVFSSNTRVGRSGLRRLAITLDIILYTTLHNAIGLNLSGEVAFSYLGIKAMKDSLSTFKTVLNFRESSTTSIISCFTILQHALKKSTLKPSGPGAFPLCISVMTSSIYSSVTSLLRF